MADADEVVENSGAKWQCIDGISHEQVQETLETKSEIGVEAEKQKGETCEEGCTSLTGRIGHLVPDSDSGAVRSPRCIRHTWEGDGSVPGYQVPEHKAESKFVLETLEKERKPSQQDAA